MFVLREASNAAAQDENAAVAIAAIARELTVCMLL